MTEAATITLQSQERPNLASVRMWQSDPAFQEIRKAFILGWSLVELRSRIQVAALDDSKLPPQAMTVRGPATFITADPVQLVKGTNERLLRASRLRTIFNTIVALQLEKFPTSVTIDTLYDPPPSSALPYLYPPAPDYANIGIHPLKDQDGQELWTGFRLFEVTRRAINCLTLLLVTPADSLIPGEVERQQRDLCNQILQSAEEECPEEAEGAVAAPTLAATAFQVYRQYNREGAGAQQTQHGMAITTLSHFTIRMLEAWDGYLRERISAEGVGDNNLVTLLAYEAGRNLATLSWSTSVNTVLLENQAREGVGGEELLEKVHQVWRDTFTGSGLIQALHQVTALSTVLDDAYYRYNEKPPALTTESTIDDLLVQPDPSRPSQVLQAVRQSIEYWQGTVLWLGLPESGDPGTRRRMNCESLALEDWRRLRSALIEQSGIWFNLMTAQQDLRGFTVESITQQLIGKGLDEFRRFADKDLRDATKEAVDGVFKVVSDSVSKFGEMAEQVAAGGLKRVVDSSKPFLWIAIGIGALGFFVLLIVSAILLFTPKDPATSTTSGNMVGSVIGALVSAATAVLSALGINRSEKAGTKSEQDIKQKINQETTAKQSEVESQEAKASKALDGLSLAGSVSGALEQAGGYLLKAYNDGLKRIHIELQSLNYSVAVSHPLVEYFIRHDGIDVHEDMEFLTKVIWSSTNRQAQLNRVITAAFGPLSILLSSPSDRETVTTDPLPGQNAPRQLTAAPQPGD